MDGLVRRLQAAERLDREFVAVRGIRDVVGTNVDVLSVAGAMPQIASRPSPYVGLIAVAHYGFDPERYAATLTRRIKR